MNAPSEITLFFGRLHVLLLHLPIALILLLGLLEWLSCYPKLRHANAASGIMLAFAVPAAVLTALFGWLLSAAGGYDAHLLQWHKWTGIATAAVFALSGLLFRLQLRTAYRASLFSSILVLVIASHFGGSLTHGSDYLARYAPGPLRTWLAIGVRPSGVHPSSGAATSLDSNGPADPRQQNAFTALIEPVLQQNCIGCHGPEKSKGHLRLDSFSGMLQGGENGPAIVPGKPAESQLIKRVKLPLASDDHMPPEGKPQPTPNDIALLHWWIERGAPTNKTIAELNPSGPILALLPPKFKFQVPPTHPTLTPLPPDRALSLASTVASELGIVITPIAQNEPWLGCNASVAGTNFGDRQLSALTPLRANLRWLDLSGTAITDLGLPLIAQMANLKRLHLERTSISDEGLRALAPLSGLEYLNLYGTGISDSGLEHLQLLPQLKQLYLWQTKVSPEAATNFAQARVDAVQLGRWQEEIEQLKAKIREAQFVLNIGEQSRVGHNNETGTTNTILATNVSGNASAALLPINTQCPVSGKATDPAKTLVQDGNVIAFCCDDCKRKFQQDPQTFLAKLSAALPAKASSLSKER